MSREILFRGKRIDNGEWVEGYLIACASKAFIVDASDKTSLRSVTTGREDKYDWRSIRVDPATAGQYTGLVDKHGKKVFEGDVCRTDDGQVGEIEFILEHCAFLGYTRNPPAYHYLESDGQMRATEIIGNIHDNHELLEATP